jgi:hypothetical protein
MSRRKRYLISEQQALRLGRFEQRAIAAFERETNTNVHSEPLGKRYIQVAILNPTGAGGSVFETRILSFIADRATARDTTIGIESLEDNPDE